MRKVIIITLLLFYSTFNLAQNKLAFDFDFAQFGYDSTSNYVEFYYSFDQSKLSLIENNNSFLVKAKLMVQLQNLENNEFIVNKQWMLNNAIKDTANFKNAKSLVGVLGFVVPKGNYRLSISANDGMDKSLSFSKSEEFNVVPFIRDNFTISDVQLASNIKKEGADKNSLFFKNTLEVEPNPTDLYSKHAPVLFYYSEVYNLLKSNSKDKLFLQKLIVNSNNDVIYNKKQKMFVNNKSIVEIGAINLKKYPTDTYKLTLIVSDSNANRKVFSSKKFFLYNPDVKLASTGAKAAKGFIGSQFAVYTMKECDDLFRRSRYIARQNEIDQYDSIDSLNAKRDFLYKFWRKRDPFPETRKNEALSDYLKRIAYVNKHFGTMQKEGFKTDRGRVYLEYGPPDQIDRYPNQTEQKPYEIWQYQSIEGGVIFVFADLTGYSDYELLTSTKRGEVRDDNWQRRIAIQ